MAAPLRESGPSPLPHERVGESASVGRWSRCPVGCPSSSFALALLAACGGDERPATQPTPSEATFQRGTFDDLPLHPRSEPLGEKAEKDGVVARSFKATGATPVGVLEWYRGNLPGWELIDPPAAIGEGTFRGRWARDASVLVVSASAAPTLPSDSGNGVSTQYSLTLEPR